MSKEWLQLAKMRLDNVVPPIQSNFRVYAIITWNNNENDTEGWVSGTNSETSYIGGSICAERAAAVQLRELPQTTKVTALYLISDLKNDCITPGVLCREYLLSLMDPDAPIHLANYDLEVKRETTLRKLYPYPSIYERISRDNLLITGEKLAEIHLPLQFGDKWMSLYKQIQKETSRDQFGYHIHPITYAAGIKFQDESVKVTWQKAGMEYGTTVDAVTGLLNYIEKDKKQNPPILLLMLDQFGLPHAPFAPARAQLFERGYSDIVVGVLDFVSGTFEETTVQDLVPDCPKMSELWPSIAANNDG